jgi:putative DNA methylase
VTKLVEVALPLETISAASRRDKDCKTGTIKNVHKWFAPMPTPAWRALLFATLVDDPGDEAARAELLDFVARLVPSHGGAPDEATLAEARERIHEATGGHLPTVFDPFCGGGSTLVEAQRLGLRAVGSDLNPVPVLITRVLTELVPQVAGRPPLVGDPAQLGRMAGGPLDGFLADCAHYARRVRDEVWDQVGHLYPPAPGGGTVVAWRWARTVTCPNPACRATAPLISSFWLSKKKGAETWVDPVDGTPGGSVRFEVRTGAGGPSVTSTAGKTAAHCLVCQEAIALDHIRSEGRAGRGGFQLLAAALDGPGGRSFLSPDQAAHTAPAVARPSDTVDLEMPTQALGFRVQLYGMTNYADLFTNRQLVALGAFADAVATVPNQVEADGGSSVYARAVASVLGLCLGKQVATSSTQSRWYIDSRNGSSQALPAFGSHRLPMVWDFAEANPFGGSAGDWLGHLDSVVRGLRSLPGATSSAQTFQADARVSAKAVGESFVLATDPPYFAQIGYADLSDYFYVWLRRALVGVHSDLFATVATPKRDELIAAPYRHGGSKAQATRFFVEGYTEAFRNLAAAARPNFPQLIVYAHRQEESANGALTSTAWDAMLSAVLAAGLRIVGTWPIHATHSSRQRALGSNALASYVVLVCRPQIEGAKVVDRQRFIGALHAELPKAIHTLQAGAISSIDLGQATLGPGMAIFSSYAKVVEPTGEAMTVRSALELIGQVQGEVLDEFVGDLDRHTRWAMGWYRDHGFDDGTVDDAEKLCKTTNTSLAGLEASGVLRARGGKVALLARPELPDGWDPAGDRMVTVWEVTQHLVKRLTAAGGEQAAADLLGRCRKWADEARNLAYWLSATAAGHNRAKDAFDYDALVTSWPELAHLAERGRSQEALTFSPDAESESPS